MLFIPVWDALTAFVNSYFFTAIFRNYMPKEEEQEHTDATPCWGEEDEEMKEANFGI